MKPTHYLRIIALALPFVALPMWAASSEPVVNAKSVFVIPNSPKEGRDPFFPNSNRPYESSPAAKTVNNAMLHTLKVKSIQPGRNGQVFAIINNHAFAPGEEGSVINDEGQRINIRCLEINVTAGTVTIESAGARATLNFSDKP